MRARLLRAWAGCLARLWARREGISAVEFALVAPLLVTMLLGTVSLTTLQAVDRKLTSAASSVGDLVTQAEQLSDEDMVDIFAAADAIIWPYDKTRLSVIITSIKRNAGSKTVVVWSEAMNDTPRVVDSEVTLPTGVLGSSNSIIMVEASYQHSSEIQRFLSGITTIRDRFYFRPRRSVEVERIP